MRRAASIVMRSFEPRDARFVRSLAADAFAEYDGGKGGARVLAMTSARGARTVIAEIDGRQAGFVVVVIEGERAHLAAIAVSRDRRGFGIGRELLRAAEVDAAARSAVVVQLETGEANLEAMEMFVRAGYALAGRIARYYRTGYDALVYRKQIDARRLHDGDVERTG